MFRRHSRQTLEARETTPASISDRRSIKPDEQPITQTKPNITRRKIWFILPTLIVIMIIGLGGWLYLGHKNASPVPKDITKAVNFPVYYPDQAKLPAGYKLDTKSFRHPVQNGVTYTVTYSSSKRIIFSVQPKPADSELQAFQSNYLPLHTTFSTSIGPALIGAYKLKSFVSLPITGGPWLIITAPSDINQDQLKQVLNSIKQ